MSFDSRLYIIDDLFNGTVGAGFPHTIVAGPIPVEIVSVQLDSSLEGVPNVPQGDGSLCVKFQDSNQRDTISAVMPLTQADRICLITDGTTWNPATEKPPGDALVVVDLDFERTTLKDC